MSESQKPVEFISEEAMEQLRTWGPGPLHSLKYEYISEEVLEEIKAIIESPGYSEIAKLCGEDTVTRGGIRIIRSQIETIREQLDQIDEELNVIYEREKNDAT